MNKIYKTIYAALFLLIILTIIYSVGATDTNTITNNTTITINHVQLTVPQTDNPNINDTDTLSFYNYITENEEFTDLDIADNWNNEGTAHSYQDTQNKLDVMVINKTDLPYIDKFSDGVTKTVIDDPEIYIQCQKTLDDKVVLVWVYYADGESLARSIVDSAVKV